MHGLKLSRTFTVAILLLALSWFAHGQMSLQRPDPTAPSEITFHANGGSSSRPIKVVQIMVGTTEIPLDTPIVLKGMWMRNFRIVVQNVTPKTIVQASITLLFPQIKAEGTNPVPSIPMSLGRFPERAFMRRDGTTPKTSNTLPEIEIAPGSSVEFNSYEQADAIQSQAYSLADHFSKVNITIGTIYFSDGSKWVTGRYFEATAPPVVWQEITPAQFFSGSRIPPQ